MPLEDLGYRTVIACDGEEALAVLGSGEQVALLFSDYVMPGLTGGELAARRSGSGPASRCC